MPTANTRDEPYTAGTRIETVAEDPVCGSGHCHIAPIWAERLGKSTLRARQASRRGGTLICTVGGGRCSLAGGAVLYSVAELNV